MTNRSALLARSITCASSKQSFLTAKLMVDKGLKDDCYRAYGYFRWVDDIVDVECVSRVERVAFMNRQLKLAETLYYGVSPVGLGPEEEMLADLIHHDHTNSPLLYSYITNFLAIIAFDADRKGHVITHAELDWYANTLGKAVTDGIQYFVCNGHPYPDSADRYAAATAAHITHMLRDYYEDIPDGFINYPRERLTENHKNAPDMTQPEFKEWVQARVELARQLFSAGKIYLDSLPVLRCKIVGYWYCARFERILDQILADDYALRPVYPQPSKISTWIKYALIAIKLSGVQFWSRLIRIFPCRRSESPYSSPSQIKFGPTA
jgi:phytoene/squalene synthetase